MLLRLYGKTVPRLHVVKIFLRDDIAATRKDRVFVADDCGLANGVSPWIFRTINETYDIAIIEIPETVNLIGNRNFVPDAVHDLGRHLKTKVRSFRSDVEQDVAGCGDGVAARRPAPPRRSAAAPRAG